MKPLSITLCSVFVLLSGLASFAGVITVKQDGTGDHTSIQSAIHASSHSDTVLVYPGTYFENLHYAGKNITLASLNLTTGDDAFIHNTIIDGNRNGSCVRVNLGETDAILYGFKIQNGSGFRTGSNTITAGGGIYIGRHEAASIFNCIVKNNFASGSGGGIACNMYSSVYISKTSIFNNYAYMAGGGLFVGYEVNCTFDTINPSNIYLNYASRGCDVKKGSTFPLHLALDTFTVKLPTPYFLSSTDINGFEIDEVTYDILNHKISPADTNLYVDPVNGNDNNRGTSINEPLKTIAFANTLIAVDSLDRNTIFIGNGVYSDSTNGEKFPLNIRPNTKYVGQSRDGTLLDGEYKTMIAKGNNEVSNYSFSNMTLKRGTFIDYDEIAIARVALLRAYRQNENISFDSILFTRGHCREGFSTVNVLGSNNTRFTNCEFSHNKGDAALRIPFWDPTDTCRIYNCIFYDNKPDHENPEYQIGRALYMSGDHGVGIVANSLFYNNDWNAFVSIYPSNNYLVNCTFADNNHGDGSMALLFTESTTTMFNCIQYNEGTYPIYLANIEKFDTTRLYIYHSLIEKGENAIYVHSSCNNGWCIYHYDDKNIEGDPLFYGGAEFPYNLSDGSPCIDAGTLELPAFIELPELDLAGNPRVFNGKIDMGAYEWNPTVDVKEFEPPVSEKKKLLSIGPNPFRTETTITAIFEKSADVRIEVFANSGLLVKVLAQGKTLPGQSKIRWNGTDEQGNTLKPGIYYILMSVDGAEADQLKVVKL